MAEPPLFVFPVIGVTEIDGVEINALQHQIGEQRHPRFGVPHCRRVIAVDIAKFP